MTFYDFLAKFAWFRREIYFGRSVAHAFLLGAAKYGDPDRLRQYLTGKKVGDQGMYLVPKAVQYLSQEAKIKVLSLEPLLLLSDDIQVQNNSDPDPLTSYRYHRYQSLNLKQIVLNPDMVNNYTDPDPTKSNNKKNFKNFLGSILYTKNPYPVFKIISLYPDPLTSYRLEPDSSAYLGIGIGI